MKITIKVENDIVCISPGEMVNPSLINFLDKEKLKQLLVEYGVVVLRGFSSDVDIFYRYINQVSHQVVKDPARSGSGNKTLVDAGYNAVGLHLENGTFSKVPDVCWFYCEIPPENGSQTTVCDGELVLNSLSETALDYFTRHKVRFKRVFSEGQWRRIVALYYPHIGGPNEAGSRDLYHWALEQEGQEFEVHQDGSATSVYTVGAIRYSNISGRLAFANSLLTPSYNYVPPKITQANGVPIPSTLWEEVKHCTEACTRELNWQSNDIVVMDNTRVMHGRRAIVSKKRKIYNTLSYV